ncbi:tRNA lysidine(34) synthetase TilS [Neobacillus mesonae]|uniref:tRNA lysidine(34) synthetase TilS n=1 Tax=Neobacillus mesonae TaxID=1193713 RepID=UPI002E1B1AB8|nr:tRNA lysidine(34) synthetase TilS [Neobacillus mesonae]MED4204795.1 tRNA lysidine(34) synthetase TilS [Neobacillus mesonae]
MLETKVERFLRHHSFVLDHKRMVVGVSGGPDSLALLHFLLREREKRNLFIVTAHIDHMFRGQESYEDAMFVKSFCEDNKIPFEMLRVDVSEIMEASGKSSQVAAREVRYDFYSKIMDIYDCSYVALAHHGDDQTETILMRLTRGSTGMARAGIRFTRPFHTGVIFRPFLCLTKTEIEEYCTRHHLTPRLDPSNEKNVYSRNRFRLQVLPFLKKENPQVHEQFQRFSEELQTDELFLQELTVQELNKVVEKRKECEMAVDIQAFLKMPLPLQRRGIQLILNYLYKEKPLALSALHIDQVLHLIIHGKPSGRLDFPNGLNVLRSYGELVFTICEVNTEHETYHFVLNGPGTVNLPNGSIKLQFAGGGEGLRNGPNTAVFAADDMKWPIIIRTRKTGDRMTVKGMAGSKKLKDIFIDQKIPLQNRHTWPVVTDGDDCIIWLPGLKKSSYEGLRQTTKHYIQLIFEK